MLELMISPLSPPFCKGSEGVYCRAPAPDRTLMLLGKAFVRTKPHSRGRVLPKGYRSWGKAQGHQRAGQTDCHSPWRVSASVYSGKSLGCCRKCSKTALQMQKSQFHTIFCPCSWMRGWPSSERVLRGFAVVCRRPVLFKASHQGSRSSCKTTSTPWLSCPSWSWASAVSKHRLMSW